jgi:hypothetical protein
MEWDVFISHASEDQEGFVRPLVLELQSHGLKVWYAEFSLKLGNSLSESIDRGLAESKFGVVILSKHFFEKEWPRRELNGLVARESDGAKVILPLWHGVTQAEVARYSPILADRFAVDTSLSLSHVANKILEVVCPESSLASLDWEHLKDWRYLLEYKTQHNLNEMVNSPQFLSQYPLALSASQFVNKLCDDLDRGQAERGALVTGMIAGVYTRAQVLRIVIRA